MSQARIAHFGVSGEFLTRTARDLVLSERPGQAWRLLVEGLQGDGIEKYATKILDGRLKLVGTESSMRTLRDDAKHYLEEVRYIYAGRVRLGGTWWRPRAVVTDYGQDDAHAASDEINRRDASHKASIHDWYRVRTAYYAKNGEKVVDVDGKYFIFESTSEPPFWRKEIKTAKEALADFDSLDRHLDKESWKERFGSSVNERSIQVAEAFTQAVSAISAKAERAEREEQEREREMAYQARCAAIRVQVLAQAGDDLLDLRLDDATIVPVPRAPFVQWALRRTAVSHLAPAWKPVSPSGLKMIMDDPSHTDWVLGAGRSLSEAYDGPLKAAAEEAMFELQEKYGNYECSVIVDGPELQGIVGKDIIVLPDLHPDRLSSLLNAKAVITQTGGRLAHLAQVALGRSIPILRVPDACTRYPEGTRLTLRPSEGTIWVSRFGVEPQD